MARLAAFLVALCLWPMLATAGLAHAVLLEAAPASGAVLDAMVGQVHLRFSEAVSPMAFRLLQPDGGTQALTGSADDSMVSIDLPAAQQPGTYFVEWHVVSADGHPVAGSIALALGSPSVAEAAPVLADPIVRAGLWLATVLMFAGAAFGVGGAVFGAFLPHGAGNVRSPIVTLPLFAAALGVLASIPFHGAETLGVAATALLDPATWRAAFATTYGSQAIGFGLAILLAAVATRFWDAVAATLAVIGLIVLCASLLLSGHASTAEPRWLAGAALVAHIAGLSFWIGALPGLFVALARPSARSAVILGTFSRLIVYAVAILIASGVTLAVLQLGAPGAAWLSPYGLVLVGKLVILVLLFSIAAWNRFVLTRPTLAGDTKAAAQLRLLVAVEIGLVLVVLGIVGLWRFTPPPRVLAQIAVAEAPTPMVVPPQPVERADTHLHSSGIMANFEIVDRSRTIVELYPEDAEADVRSVTIHLTPPVADAVPLTLEATPVGDDTWTATAPPLSEGRWTVLLEIRVGDFDLAKLKGALRVGTVETSNAD